MTTIRPDSVRITPTAELPSDWAGVLGGELSAELSAADRDLLVERVVGLGHGVQLSHLRTHAVHEPTLGAWRARDCADEERDWLWLVVLVPAGDPSRHLGWMAHLAAGLHEEQRRRGLREAVDDEGLIAALRAVLAASAAPSHPQVEVPASPSSAPSHRLVVAILKEVEYVDHLLQLFVEHDVRGATVLEARGMAEHLAAHMSLFAGFRSAFRAVGHSQMIISVVPTERTAEVLELIRNAAGGMRTPGSGIAFALDISATLGLAKGEAGNGGAP